MLIRPSNSFKISLLISISIHSIFFLPFFKIRFFPKELFSIQPQISYIEFVNLHTDFLKQQLIQKKELLLSEDTNVNQQILQSKQDKVSQSVQQKKKPAGQDESHMLKTEDSFVKIQERLKKEETENAQEKFKENKSQDIKEDIAYQNYYKSIRELIRRSVKYPKRQIEGDIYVNFILLKNGQLMDVLVLDEESTNSSILKEAALRGIKEATPFPPFPDSVQKKSLNLSVIISFRMNE
ncbi:MAG: TonB family protein [Candidatus Omnitrophica bacterium]|nr:TonB family protein [Candidatus Omnitrophota bacterium]